MQTEQMRETRETPQIKKQREQTEGSGVITPDEKPSFGYRLILALSFLAINFVVAGIYFHVINP